MQRNLILFAFPVRPEPVEGFMMNFVPGSTRSRPERSRRAHHERNGVKGGLSICM